MNQSHSDFIPERLEQEISLSSLFQIIKSHFWLITLMTILGFIIGFFISTQSTTYYKTSALIQVNDALTKNSVLSGLSNFTGKISQASPSQKQIALIKSRYILEPVIRQMNLRISSTPIYVPIVGKTIAHFYHHAGLSPAFLNLKQYAWGGESIKVSKLSLDPQIAALQPLSVVVENKEHFKLYDADNNLILSGKVGSLAHSKIYPKTAILITQMTARNQQRFSVKLTPLDSTVNKLKSALSISDAGKNSSNNVDTGVLSISLKWASKTQAPTILNTLLNVIKEKDLQQKTQTAQQALAFVEQQLPHIKKDMVANQIKLNNYKAEKGIINPNAQALSMLKLKDTLLNKQNQLHLLKKKLSHYFQPKHPIMNNINLELKTVNDQLKGIAKKVQQTPRLDQKALSLTRNLKIEDSIYSKLANQVQQLQILKAGTTGNVQILNHATTTLTPLPSNQKQITIFSGLGALLLTIIIVVTMENLAVGIRDPLQLEKLLNISLHAIIPFSKAQKKIAKNSNASMILALTKPKDIAIESLRSLRTTLSLNMLDEEHRIIYIMGPSPSIGKSFITLNLAQVFAETGKKICLICADLRKGKIHRSLNQAQSPGLTEFLQDKACMNEIIRSTPNLDFVSCGSYPENPAELLSKDALSKLLSSLEKQYDLIIVDTPPILAVTDGCIIAQNPGMSLLTVGLGKNQIDEVRTTIKRLESNKISINGMICNYYTQKQQNYNYHSYYYYKYN